MIEIKSEGTAFEMFPETTLSLELNNPMFSEGDFIPGSFALPVDVPANSSINRQKLKNPTLITNKLKFANNIPAQLFYKKVPWLHGKVNVKPVSPTKIPLSFVTETSALPDVFKNTSIRSLDYLTVWVRHDWSDGLDYGAGNERSGKIMVFERDIYAELGDTTEILVNGQRFISDDNIFGLNGRMNEIVSAINDSGVARASYTPGADDDNNDNTPPTKAIFKIRAANPTYDSLIEVDMLDYEKWVFRPDLSFFGEYRTQYRDFLNTYKNATYPAQKFAFPMMYNPKFYNEPSQNTSGFFNRYLDPHYTVNSYDIDNPLNFVSVIPFIFLKYVLDKIAEFTGVTLSGSFYTDPEINTLLIYNTVALDHFEKFNKGQEFNMHSPLIKPSNHLPDMKINDFFKALQSTFGLGLFYDAKKNNLEIVKLNDIVKNNEYYDLTDKAENFDEFDNSINPGLTFQGKKDEKDELFKNNTTELLPYVMGEGAEKVEAGFSTVYEKTVSFYVFSLFPLTIKTYVRKVLYAEQPGGSDFGPRLVFYRGMVEDNHEPYPYASAYNVNNQGEIIGKYSLDWNGAYGLAEVWWKHWKNFLFNRAYQKRKIRLSLKDLKNLNFRKKYKIDRVLYYIKKVNVSLTMDSIKPASVELYKIPNLNSPPSEL
jgi:hypothetical protein